MKISKQLTEFENTISKLSSDKKLFEYIQSEVWPFIITHKSLSKKVTDKLNLLLNEYHTQENLKIEIELGEATIKFIETLFIYFDKTNYRLSRQTIDINTGDIVGTDIRPIINGYLGGAIKLNNDSDALKIIQEDTITTPGNTEISLKDLTPETSNTFDFNQSQKKIPLIKLLNTIKQPPLYLMGPKITVTKYSPITNNEDYIHQQSAAIELVNSVYINGKNWRFIEMLPIYLDVLLTELFREEGELLLQYGKKLPDEYIALLKKMEGLHQTIESLSLQLRRNITAHIHNTKIDSYMALLLADSNHLNSLQLTKSELKDSLILVFEDFNNTKSDDMYNYSDRGDVVADIKKANPKSWHEVSITFLNRYDVEIQIRNNKILTNYHELGFNDRRRTTSDDTRNVGWKFLYELATENGVIDKDSPNTDSKYRVRKKRLADQLQKIFGLKEDPLYRYNENNQIHDKGYKTKFSITTVNEHKSHGIVNTYVINNSESTQPTDEYVQVESFENIRDHELSDSDDNDYDSWN